MAVHRYTAQVVYAGSFSDGGAGRRKVGKKLGKSVEFRGQCMLFTGRVVALNTVDVPVFGIRPCGVIVLHNVT